jgi:hypothetical protein
MPRLESQRPERLGLSRGLCRHHYSQRRNWRDRRPCASGEIAGGRRRCASKTAQHQQQAPEGQGSHGAAFAAIGASPEIDETKPEHPHSEFQISML